MEFRIAPIFIAILNLLFLCIVLYNAQFNHTEITLKMAFLPIVFVFVARGAYKRHDYYSQSFKTIFSIVQALNICGIVGVFYFFKDVILS